MTTPRSPFVCIGDSLLNEDWPPHVKLALVMLSCHMHQRWRSDRRLSLEDVAGWHLVTWGALHDITGRRTRTRAQRVMNALATRCSLVINWCDTGCIISWPKWAEYNRTNSRSPGRSAAPPKPKPKPKPKSEIPEPAKRAPAVWALESSKLLIELLEDVEGARIPRGARASWARHIERLVGEVPELKKLEDPGPRLEAAIRFALGPENRRDEYEVVIRSGSALREKWSKLVQRAKRLNAERDRSPQGFEARVVELARARAERAG